MIYDGAQGTLSKHFYYNSYGWEMRLKSPSLAIQWYEDNTWKIYSASSGVTLDGWHYVVGVRRGTTLEIWIDGVLKGTGYIPAYVNSDTTAPFTIGVRSAADYGWAKGIIDEIRIYNRALSEEEIKFLYEEGLKKLTRSGMQTFNSNIKPYIAISNPSGKIYVENLRVGNLNSKEIKLIKPFYNLEFESSFRFSKGSHQIKIENIGFNYTSKRPIIRISEE
jgi:hypothetical protein